MLLAGALAVWLSSLGTHAPGLLDSPGFHVIIEAPAMWSPDTQLVLALGAETYEVTGAGQAEGHGSLDVKLIDASACRVLANFVAEAGRTYVLRVGDVPAPTVTSWLGGPIGQDAIKFERVDFTGCDDERQRATAFEAGLVTGLIAIGVGLLLVLRHVRRNR